jgi:hypothetical protein
VDARQAVKQVSAIKDVGDQFLCRFPEHYGRNFGPGRGFYAELEGPRG